MGRDIIPDEFPMAPKPEVRYVRYDDGWLRDMLNTLRTDLRGHMSDDKEAIDNVRSELHEFREKLDEIHFSLEKQTWLWKTGATAFRWVILLVAGTGGMTALFGKQITFLLSKIG